MQKSIAVDFYRFGDFDNFDLRFSIFDFFSISIGSAGLFIAPINLAIAATN
jgi:hypothetical protein